MTRVLITTSDADRGALDLILGWFPFVADFDPYQAGYDSLNDFWDDLARALLALPALDFEAILLSAQRVDGIAQAQFEPFKTLRNQDADNTKFVAQGARRAIGLLDIIVRWRAEAREAAETARRTKPHWDAGV